MTLNIRLLAYCFCLFIPANGVAEEKASRWSAPPLEQAISIRNGQTNERLTYGQFIAEIAPADVVFLGESHTDETTHRLQLAIYKSLQKLRQQKVVLALEMFERDSQEHLNQYLKGKIDERTFLASLRSWSNYREAYRPLIERAKQAGMPVVAANFPRSLARRLAIEGPEVLESLSAVERSWLPKQFFPNTPAYWKRTDNATRGHQGFVMPSNSDDERLYSMQSLWDNAMGEACANALNKHPGSCVLHINGKFHTAYWDGAVHQLRQRKPDVKVKTVSIAPTLNPSTAELMGKPIADYVVYVESLATNIDSGERSVQVGCALKYRFHLPEGASIKSPVPLLIWLTDDGLTAKEGMALCKQKFGDRVAIAVIEAPFKAVGEDFAVGGRWYWSKTFAEDVGLLVDGTERIWGYLLRHFPIDSGRVCVVGEGTGATVAAVIAVQSDRMKHHAIALHPRRYAKVKDIPLPMPEYFGDDPSPNKSLKVMGKDSLQDWWQKELDQYNDVQVESEFQPIVADPWDAECQVTNLIRKSLGLEDISAPSSGARQYLLVASSLPRALHWAKLQAIKITKSSDVFTVAVEAAPQQPNVKQVSTSIAVDAVTREGVVPKCPGPFGGTTVLVLPNDLSQAEVAKWTAIEADDRLAAKSRFHRVRIATSSGEQDLPSVLDKLKLENRKNILIVPAIFYADLSWLRVMRQTVVEYEDSMTLHWLPGLGGRPGILGNSIE
ncbi:MAG: ChaN family lipoprotein [Pirellulales bacterium]|nr:ChaN family lipoprotein [Pirellulales bacterium]